jgi:hypothetical protein
LLYKLVETTPSLSNDEYLQKMDNHLFFPKREDGDLRTNTWNLLSSESPFQNEVCENIMKQFDLQENSDYRQFSHYLFYKVEYILWLLVDKSNEFYFRAKNSVEHISPQTPNGDYKNENKVSQEYLHSFGNLALVSRERNSEFGNNPYEVKRSDFKTKKDDMTNNLKMSLIYANETWGDEACKNHLEEIKKNVSKYMNCENNEKSKII